MIPTLAPSVFYRRKHIAQSKKGTKATQQGSSPDLPKSQNSTLTYLVNKTQKPETWAWRRKNLTQIISGGRSKTSSLGQIHRARAAAN